MIPLPYHPGLARLLPFAIPALVLHRILHATQGEDGGITWRGLLVAAALTAIPLAIPIIQWLAMAFRLPLIQGLLIGGAMVLLGLDAATGAAPAWAGLVPAAWLGLWIVQRIGGPIALRRVQARNAAFVPVDPGNRLILVEGASAADQAGWLSRDMELGRIASQTAEGHPGRLRDKAYYRLAPADLERVRARVEAVKPTNWQVGAKGVTLPESDLERGDGVVTQTSPTDPPIRIRAGRHRSALWLLAGKRSEIRIDDCGAIQRLVGGEAAIVAAVPLFTCFYYLNIFPGPGSRWVAGFARAKPVKLGPASAHDLLLQALKAPAGPHHADPGPLLARLDAIAAERQSEARGLLERLLDPEAEIPIDTRVLTRHPEVAFGRGRELCACLAAAKAKKEDHALRLAAALIAALPEDEFRSLSAELITLLNSKALAFRLVDEAASIGLPERVKREHVVGGFSLVRWVPELYERLGELGRWPRPLVKARERLDKAGRQGS